MVHEDHAIAGCDAEYGDEADDRGNGDAGDAVLRAASSLLKKLFRGSDIACRLGGEEFLVILPDASSDGAVGKAEELRQAISALDLAHLGKTLGSVTVSIGVATFPEPIVEHEVLIDAADAALYVAKHEGRNCVQLASATPR